MNSKLNGDDSEPNSEITEMNPFPTTLLPRVMREIIQHTAKIHNVPEALPACCALGVISGAIGAGLLIGSGANLITLGNIYILIGAPSGAGKSIVSKELMAPLKELETDLQDECEQNKGKKIRAQKVKLMARQKGIEKAISNGKKGDCHDKDLEEILSQLTQLESEKPPRIIVEDITAEKLAETPCGRR
jgi:hypothetical protein